MTWREPSAAAPPECCGGRPMAFAGYTLARAKSPPAEVESSVWRCVACGSTWARAFEVRPVGPIGKGGAA